MNKTKPIIRIKRIAAAFVAVVLTIAVAIYASGCSFLLNAFSDDTIKFSQSSIVMNVGETYDLNGIIQTEFLSYEVISSDETVVTVSARTNVITAVGAGTAYVTAQNDFASDKLRVTVLEAEQDYIGIDSVGNLVQSDDDMSTVVFTATATGKCADKNVYWYVNGKPVRLLEPDEQFEITPSETGEYTVTAECAGITSEPITVRVLASVTATVSYSGELEQNDPFTDIVFSVTADGDGYCQWYEDGELLYEGYGGQYTYSPIVGRHELCVVVNGKTVFTEQAIFSGSVVPKVGEIEFDNLYPHAYLRYETIGKAQVEIVTPGGETNVYSQNNTEYSALFTDQGFDVGGIVELCASDASRRAYRYRVKSLGDDDVITESDYSQFQSFMQLPSGAKKYISTALPCGDLYVTSDHEYVSVMQYYVVFRQKKEKARVSFDCYIGYDRKIKPKELWDEAFHIAATSGEYKNISVTDIGGGVMRTEFTVDTVNAPSAQAVGERAEQLHAVLPHINYDANKYRADDHVFDIDRREQTTEVEYSDELYITAQGNTRPVPKAGSSAETVYNIARSVLRKICTDDMTDIQKAHAIYDWIMWVVTYDTPATLEDNGEKFSAYYLEGVFGDGDTDMGGMAYDTYAVCDGMSKAYSLMCNIEGIPCERVVGRAGRNVEASKAGGHAWNKVYINGGWYLVDCTWGDVHGTAAPFGGEKALYEFGLHNYLFLTDAQVADTHYEPYKYAKTGIVYAPKTADTPYSVYTEMTYNGVAINCLVQKRADAIERVKQIASEYADAVKSDVTSIAVPYGTGVREYKVDSTGFEIYFEGGIVADDSELSAAVGAAIHAKHPSAKARIIKLTDVVLVLVKI